MHCYGELRRSLRTSSDGKCGHEPQQGVDEEAHLVVHSLGEYQPRKTKCKERPERQGSTPHSHSQTAIPLLTSFAWLLHGSCSVSLGETAALSETRGEDKGPRTQVHEANAKRLSLGVAAREDVEVDCQDGDAR